MCLLFGAGVMLVSRLQVACRGVSVGYELGSFYALFYDRWGLYVEELGRMGGMAMGGCEGS